MGACTKAQIAMGSWTQVLTFSSAQRSCGGLLTTRTARLGFMRTLAAAATFPLRPLLHRIPIDAAKKPRRQHTLKQQPQPFPKHPEQQQHQHQPLSDFSSSFSGVFGNRVEQLPHRQPEQQPQQLSPQPHHQTQHPEHEQQLATPFTTAAATAAVTQQQLLLHHQDQQQQPQQAQPQRHHGTVQQPHSHHRPYPDPYSDSATVCGAAGPSASFLLLSSSKPHHSSSTSPHSDIHTMGGSHTEVGNACLAAHGCYRVFGPARITKRGYHLVARLLPGARLELLDGADVHTALSATASIASASSIASAASAASVASAASAASVSTASSLSSTSTDTDAESADECDRPEADGGGSSVTAAVEDAFGEEGRGPAAASGGGGGGGGDGLPFRCQELAAAEWVAAAGDEEEDSGGEEGDDGAVAECVLVAAHVELGGSASSVDAVDPNLQSAVHHYNGHTYLSVRHLPYSAVITISADGDLSHPVNVTPPPPLPSRQYMSD